MFHVCLLCGGEIQIRQVKMFPGSYPEPQRIDPDHKQINFSILDTPCTKGTLPPYVIWFSNPASSWPEKSWKSENRKTNQIWMKFGRIF